ncbi:DUF1826 domain-containing protein [Vibrio lentus]|nr:DUF1826 domain-containing protein [Vibrio lentus]
MVSRQWLPNYVVDRSKLGRGANGQPDSASGLYTHESDIQQMASGDVALLKGSAGVAMKIRVLYIVLYITSSDETRLLLTLDFGYRLFMR